jgi:hypothetical protein
MEKKQTAVEWFWNNLTDDMIGDLSPEQIGSIYKLMEQAKQMEKEQMKEAHLIADHYPRGYEFDKYYNETYGGNE